MRLDSARRPAVVAVEPPSWVLALGASALTVLLAGAIGSTHQPGRLSLAAIAGILVLAAALFDPRLMFAAALFALAGYLPDVLIGTGAASEALLIVVAGAIVLRTLTHVESWRAPRELAGLGAYAVALVLASVGATDSAAATSRLVDYAGFALLIVLMLLLVDSETALRRALWCVAGAIGVLAFLALVQRAAHLDEVAFGGLATVVRDGSSLRSGGPLSANFFGEILVAAAMLAAYLALDARSRLDRAVAIAIVGSCVGAMFETGSRGAFVALVVGAALFMVLRRVRVVTALAVVVVALIAASLLLSGGTRSRLSQLGGLSVSSIEQNSSFRGRLSENLAAVEMWRAHPLLGVGPGNFESHYLSYAPGLNLDQRAEPRSAHSLYLEALAETGLVGALAFFGLIGFALSQAWRGRRSRSPSAGLLAEGALVAMVAFLVAAVTLHQAYPRFLWMFIGLTLVAGRVARSAPE